jgi:2-oxoglutarate dehydrogenase E2 component (dihydrolipoamide succinyltransferase)
MSLVDLIMPKLGESIMEATILKWHKQPGDTIAMDETVLDIATDKVDSEVPSTASGVLEAILFNENDVVPIGTVIAKIKVEGMVASVTAAAPPAPNGIWNSMYIRNFVWEAAEMLDVFSNDLEQHFS